MKEHALFLRDPADLRDGMNRADFVVRQHDRNQNGLIRDGVPHVVRIDPAGFIDGQIRDLDTFFLQRLRRIDHRAVFGRRGDDVITFLLIHLDHAFQRQVIGLGSSAREHDLLGVGVNEIGNVFARLVHALFGFPTEGMVPARGIAELFGEIREHRIHHARVAGRGRMVVHING